MASGDFKNFLEPFFQPMGTGINNYILMEVKQ
jgi:hypothetical protein